jgi:hypothetical protein
MHVDKGFDINQGHVCLGQLYEGTYPSYEMPTVLKLCVACCNI